MTRPQPKAHVRFLEEYEFLRKYAFRCTVCPEIADNIVQDVFFKFVTNAEKWNLEDDIRPILIRLTKISAADHWRRHFRAASLVRQEVAREIHENEEEQAFYKLVRKHEFEEIGQDKQKPEWRRTRRNDGEKPFTPFFHKVILDFRAAFW